MMGTFAVKRPVTVIMFSIGLIVLGFISASRIPMRLLPQIVTPSFTIVTEYSGATAGEIEEKITIPIEKAVSTTTGLYRMRSESTAGRSSVQLGFTSDVDVEAITITGTLKN